MKSVKRQTKTKEEVKSSNLDSGFHSTSVVEEMATQKQNKKCYEVDSGLGIEYNSPSTSTFSNLSVTDDSSEFTERVEQCVESEEQCKECGDSGFDINLSGCSLNEPEPELEDRVQVALKNAENLSRECSKSLTPSFCMALLNETFQQDKDGDTRLHLSVIVGRLDLVFSFIFLAPHAQYLDIQNDQSQTALHLAVLTNQPTVVRYLMLAGANLLLRDHQGNTALHLACQWGFLDCVKQLTMEITSLEELFIRVTSPSHLPPRKPPILPSTASITDVQNYQGRSCVHLAATNQNTDSHKILLWLKKCGADIDAKEGCGGRTSITFAVESRDTNMVDFLVKKCSANINEVNYAGQTAYQIAYQNDRKIADQLRSLGAQTFYDDDDQYLDSDDEITDICSAAIHSQTPPSSPLLSQNEENRNFYDLKINGEPLW